tara:strand:- start:296 stop:1120 length:825 start_codon:yes stop_codon:yes gene_type:complete
MKVIIPMAGTGQRFVDRGYLDPKPLIKVNGKRIIEYILDIFSPDDEIIFICNSHHLDHTPIEAVLNYYCPTGKIIRMENHKKGPIYTVKAAYDYIEDGEPVIVSYCDNPYIWNREEFDKHVVENDLDGCILTHTGFHPHVLANTKMAFLKMDENNHLAHIKEKECYTDDPMSEHASTGTYYFKEGRFMKRCFDETMKRDINYNGEYYVTLAYNVLVETGHRIGYFDTDCAMVMGTPEEVANIESWYKIINGGQVKDEESLLKCYRYWKAFHEKT